MMTFSLGEFELLAAVNLEDAESIVALHGLLHWPKRKLIGVRVLPFIKAPLNTAADVPKGESEFEAYKDRRAEARRRYQRQEHARNLERLGRSSGWEMTTSGVDLAHDVLIKLFLGNASLEQVLKYISELLKISQRIDAQGVVQVVDALGLGSGFDLKSNRATSMRRRLIDLSQQLESQGILSAPSLLFKGEAYLGYGHLPQIESILAFEPEGPSG
jgi:2-hydroxychromene-2-carboxylate isomerase